MFLAISVIIMGVY